MTSFARRVNAVAALLLFCLFCEAAEKKCDNSVLDCIKKNNGGKYPVNAWTSLALLWNRNYAIVWYSESLVKKDNLKCISTVFGPFGATDTYYHTCTNTEKISFKPSFSNSDHTFTINDYKGINMKAYAVHYKKYCLTLYVCSPDGVTGPHITIYCPSSMLDDAKVKAEIEEAKTALTACKINDGTRLCQEKCS